MTTTYRLPDAAKYLHVHPQTLQQMARKGEIAAAKIGRAWVFREEDLSRYLHTMVMLQTKQRNERPVGRPRTL